LKTLQQLERGVYDDHLSDSFTRGILSGKTNSRDLVEGLATRPDYRRLQKIMELLPDEETKDSLRRAVVDKMLRPSSLPGARRVNVPAIRDALERGVGRETLDNIAGPETTKNVDQYLRAHEALQAYKDRGETARVMISLTQGSKAMSLFDALGTSLTTLGGLGHVAGYAGVGDVGVLIGAGLLLGPWAAAKAITSPSVVNQYMKFVKYASKKEVSQNVLRRQVGDLLPKFIDEKVASRLLGRGAVKWGTQPGDQEDENYIRRTIQQPA